MPFNLFRFFYLSREKSHVLTNAATFLRWRLRRAGLWLATDLFLTIQGITPNEQGLPKMQRTDPHGSVL